jgi:bifunctional UDP-N-acetylglucosamine pyrophosphorylase/glucosamine-1-phosphate N-acetyltransferase
MQQRNVLPLIMAAGKGTRMKSDLPKVLHEINGKALCQYVIDAVKIVSSCKPVLIIGHEAEQVKQIVGDTVDYVLQVEQLGTGHAVMMAEKQIQSHNGLVMVLTGDAPLIQSTLLNDMIELAENQLVDAVLLSAKLDDPYGYGRIVRNNQQQFEQIIEQKDASEQQQTIQEVNAGVYLFKAQSLQSALAKLDNNNAQNEYYLTDVLANISQDGGKIAVFTTDEAWQMLGINDRVQLANVGEKMNALICEKHMLNGVTIIDPKNTYIGADVSIGRETIIYPSNYLEGVTTIGEGTRLYHNNRIVNTTIGAGCQVQSSVLLEATVGAGTTVGPFAYLRPGSQIGKNVRIGDFVEVKNSQIHDGAKVSHLTYIGDGEIGENTNIGCGVVFVNYDGKHKHKTKVGKDAFIGCNVNLVAPVEVEDDSYVAAGSTITKHVGAGDLAIARQRQENKEQWVYKKNKSSQGGNE